MVKTRRVNFMKDRTKQKFDFGKKKSRIYFRFRNPGNMLNRIFVFSVLLFLLQLATLFTFLKVKSCSNNNNNNNTRDEKPTLIPVWDRGKQNEATKLLKRPIDQGTYYNGRFLPMNLSLHLSQ